MTPTLKANPVTACLADIALAAGMRGCKGLVFCATTGRSGSKSLAAVLRSGGAVAVHEPWPFLNGYQCVNRPIEGDARSRRAYAWHKSVNIKRKAQHAAFYVETSHLFIKSFCDYVFQEFGDLVKVVHLVRDPEKVALSLMQLGTIPGTEKAADWYCDPASPNNLLRLPESLRGNDLAACLWYCYEIEARVEFWRERYP